MMQRIYGTAWLDQESLDQHLHQLEEAKKRDHRKIARDLDLVMFHPLAPASPFFLPRGAIVYNLLVDYMRELYQEYGYQEVVTPQLFAADLWKTSGHYDQYKEDMYFLDSEDAEFGVKPMNCPGHMLIFGSDVRSYRDLPWRIADFGRLHRYERSGVTRGLTRVRSFAQDDSHIFLAPEMIGEEIDRLFLMIERVYGDLGLEFPRLALGTRPEGSVGDGELWEKAERILTEALERRGDPFDVNPGDGAFYGPKIDFTARDAIGREWQLTTVQLDFNLPERFDLKYTAADGSRQRPVVIHRALLGSIERFLGVYLEHTAGLLPLWLAPEQVRVLTIAADFDHYAGKVLDALKAAGIRCSADTGTDKIGAKVRNASLLKIPVLFVVGAARWRAAASRSAGTARATSEPGKWRTRSQSSASRSPRGVELWGGWSSRSSSRRGSARLAWTNGSRTPREIGTRPADVCDS